MGCHRKGLAEGYAEEWDGAAEALVADVCHVR